MKRALLTLALLGLMAGSVPAQTSTQGQRGVSIESRGAGTTDYIRQGCRSITFIFSSDYTGTIKGIAFTGAADSSITITAPDGDTLGDIAYTVTAGTLRIVYTR